MQTEIPKARIIDDNQLAQAIDEPTELSLSRDLHPRIMAGVVIAVIQVVVNSFPKAKRPAPMFSLLSDALRQLQHSLPKQSNGRKAQSVGVIRSWVSRSRDRADRFSQS